MIQGLFMRANEIQYKVIQIYRVDGKALCNLGNHFLCNTLFYEKLCKILKLLSVHGQDFYGLEHDTICELLLWTVDLC